MIAYRYVNGAVFMLLLALPSTIGSFYRGLPAAEPALDRVVPTRLAGMTGHPTDREEAFGRRAFRTGDWIERRYQAPDGPPVLLFAARGYDLRPLFHYPENAILARDWIDRFHQVRPLATGHGRLWLHTLHLTGATGDQLAGYLLLDGEEAMHEPWSFFAHRLLSTLTGAPRPAALLFAATSLEPDRTAAHDRLERLLAEVAERYLAAGLAAGE